MQQNHLSVSELIDGVQDCADAVWLIALKSGKVEILKDTMTPHLENREMSYESLYDAYQREFIYPMDREAWEARMSLDSFRRMAKEGCAKRKFDMRFRNSIFGFDWYEGFVSLLRDENGDADRILVVGRYVGNYRRAQIVERAVETEYDYVVYIEADKNSYIMFSSNQKSGTPLPPVASDDYEREVAVFNRKYLPEDESDAITENLSIHHVQPILEQDEEYVLYVRMIEDGKNRYKKMRFSYYDKENNVWLLTRTDITEIREEKRQKELLQDALNAATVASRAKSEFLSRMSHDIRTPMNAIIGMTAIAGAHIDDQNRIRDCLGKITDSSRLLLGLINEVLDMSKVESGSIVLSEEEINLAELVQSVVTMMQPAIDGKRLTFNARVNRVCNENVTGDMQRLQQVLLNLLTNAVKYTPECGRILLEVSEKPSGRNGEGCFEFLVEDNGIGMKPEFMEKIFEPFERADDAKIRQVQGTGLGMAISKNVVEMMDGEIRVESTYGKGSRFTATVYLRLREETQTDGELFAGLPILVADDDEVVCHNTCERLDELGMSSQWVNNGRDAVKQAVKAHELGRDFFAVIIDLRMPGMDGIETTRQIRAKVGPEVPIIMISAYDWSEYEDAAREAGANGFIMKPLFRSRLICQLKRFVEREPVEKTEVSAPLLLGDFTGKRILLVEDNELNREIAAELLCSTGMEVETAGDGREAVNKMEESPENYYDLIFMDMQMPVMDGCEATSVIRSLSRTDSKSIPIIAMTANAFAEDVERTKKAGMDGHMAKPIDLNVLTQTLRHWLSEETL